MKEFETVPCRFCGAPTRMTETKECDPCWGLKTQMGRTSPTVLRRIVKYLADANKVEAKPYVRKAKASLEQALINKDQQR